MASPDKSVPFTFEDETYLLAFNNMARATVEDTLDKEWPEIAEKIDAGNLGVRIQAALLFGATRKHHRRDFLNLPSVYQFLDRINNSEEDDGEDYLAALYAVTSNGDKEFWRKILAGEDLEEEEEEAGEEAPKEKPQRKKKSTSPESSSSKTGTDS